MLYGEQVRACVRPSTSCAVLAGLGSLSDPHKHTRLRSRAPSSNRTNWQAKYFEDEVRPDMKHTKPGLLCMASAGENMNTSQFYITMRGEDLEVGALPLPLLVCTILSHALVLDTTLLTIHHPIIATWRQFLDGKHTIFGEVAEGLDGVLKEINELYCDTNGRPYRCVRVLTRERTHS